MGFCLLYFFHFLIHKSGTTLFAFVTYALAFDSEEDSVMSSSMTTKYDSIKDFQNVIGMTS